jgi:hypothetical protein
VATHQTTNNHESTENMMKKLNAWIDERLRRRDASFMEATARNAARDAIHYYTCLRTIDQWRHLLDEAEKSGDKYVSMADLVIESGFKK